MLLSPLTFLWKNYFTGFKQLLGKRKIKCSERCPFFSGIHTPSENFLGNACHQWHCVAAYAHTQRFLPLVLRQVFAATVLFENAKGTKLFVSSILHKLKLHSSIWYANMKLILNNRCRRKHTSYYINQKGTVENGCLSFSLLRKIKPKNKSWISEVQNEILNESKKEGH